VAWDTSNPSFSNSPWMRGAPQSTFSRLIRTIRARISLRIRGGRPPHQRPREPNPQSSHKPRRRQRKTVAGWMNTRLRCQFAHHRDRKTHHNRSLGANMDDACPFAATPPVDGEGQSILTQGHRAGETAPVPLAAGQAIPTIYEFREFAEAGGFISYGTSIAGCISKQAPTSVAS
jgi:hypothetical protein